MNELNEMEQRYQRAEQWLSWNLAPKLNNLTVEPHWLDGHRFWFRRDLQEGHEFILVDSENITLNPAFDHQRLAGVLAELLNQTVSPQQLPIKALEFRAKNQLRLEIDPTVAPHCKCILLELEDYNCTVEFAEELGKSLKTRDDDILWEQSYAHSFRTLLPVVSIDGQREVVRRGHNLFLREYTTGIETPLTDDGEPHYGYGNYSEHRSFGVFENKPMAPAVLWSPDERYLAVQRIDERQVKDMPMMQSVPEDGSIRPIGHSYKMALPGDTHVALASLCVIDLESGDIICIDRPPMPAASLVGFMECGAVEWGTDNCIYFVEWTRDRQTVRFVRFDPMNGVSRILLEEKGQGMLGPAPFPMLGQVFKVLPESNEFIWYSRCSGWGHLYRYDLTTGELKNSITSGDYVVTRIHRIDPLAGCLHFTACGREPKRNPYYEHLYRVNMDGSDLILLTPEPSHHDIVPSNIDFLNANCATGVHAISPNGNAFVETISRVDQPSRSVLRSTDDGTELMTLAQCDQTLLPDMTSPRAFTVKAADDTTDLWGVMYRPSDFDEGKHYPMILVLYGTPQLCFTQKKFAEKSVMVDISYCQALAELGFIVITLDPRGTPLRSKVFHDVAYGNLQNGGGIEDQVGAIKQLGERHAWVDLDRVGITGISGGGFASARAMLSHPNFFKVGVSNAGNHDQRLYCAGWVETFQGLLEGDNYEEQACISLAKNLEGKLLLTHGDRDANVHIAHTLQLVDELIRHNKDFDLLILPNRQHLYYEDPYYIRRLWDYFVEHLLNQKPPKKYCIAPRHI